MHRTLPKKRSISLTVDILMHGHGLSNEMHCQLQPKETKVRRISSYCNGKRCCMHRNKTQSFSFVVISFQSNEKHIWKNFINWGKKLPKTI